MKNVAWAIAISLAFMGCAQDGAKNEDPCPSGICGGGGASSTSSGGGCAESWVCTPWVVGADGMYSRTCSDQKQCGTTALKPIEGPVALPELDMDYYKCKVEPIFDRGCSMMGCHGTEVGRAFKVYARGRLRHDESVAQVASCPVGPQTVNLAKDGSGTVMCVGWSPHTESEWQQNYDNARAFMVGVENPEECELLAQPVIGGKAHAGVHLFAKSDTDYQTILKWVSGTKLGSACDPLPN